MTRKLGLLEESQLGFWNRSGFYWLDVLIGFVAVPLLLMITTKSLPERARNILVALLSATCLLVQYLQIRSFLTVGQFISGQLALSALQWAWENPQDILLYDSPGSLGKLGFLLASIALITAWKPGWIPGVLRIALTVRPILLAVPAGFLVLSATLFLGRIPQAEAYNRSALIESFLKLAGSEKDESEEFRNRGYDQLISEYRTLAGAPLRARDARYWGKAKGYDVLLFILETAPAASLPLAGDLDSFPTLKLLRRNSFVATCHHSTYPYTNRALFSIFTSQYPPNLSKGILPVRQDYKLPGFLWPLDGKGYRRIGYFPVRQTFDGDEQMFQALGMPEQIHPGGNYRRIPGPRESRAFLLERDEAVLKLALQDLGGGEPGNPPIASAFLPQVGHGPWDDLPGGDLLARGTQLMRIQDGMLGRIVEALRKSGRAGRTLIVVTGDHGLRTKMEYPGLEGGMADSIMYHVPLMIHAPGVLDSMVRIDWLTSHIDIGPTLLDLLGVEEDRDAEQGSAIWNESLRSRTTLFLGRHYFGADSFHEGGRFSMWSYASRTAYRRDSAFHFDEGSILPDSSHEAARISRKINRLTALQNALLQAAPDRDLKPGR